MEKNFDGENMRIFKSKQENNLAYFIVITLLIIIIKPAIAEITDLQVGDVWLNENNSLQISFRCDSAANVSAKISGNNQQQLIQSFDEKQFATYSIYSRIAQLDGTITGNDNPYLLTVFCEKNGNQTNANAYVGINKLEIIGIDIAIPEANPTGIVHPTDIITIKLDVTKNGNRLFSGVAFNVLIDGTAEITNIKPAMGTEKWQVSVKVPNVVGEKQVAIEAIYSGKKAAGTGSINIKPLLSVIIESPFLPYKLSDASDIEIPVIVNYKSKPLGDAVTFEAQLDGQVLTIKDIKYSDNKWTLTINVPRMAPKENAYSLNIFAVYSGIREGKEMKIQFLLPFKGILIDAKGSAVQAEIRIKKPGFEEKIIADGQYSAMLQPGKYDIELYFPAFRARLKDAQLESSEGLYSENVIKYDYFEESSRKVIALDFLLPFASARIEIPYNESGPKEILKCSNWNFAARSCNNQWEKITANVDTERNLITIENTSLSAFAITEPTELVLNVNIDKSSYQSGENIKLIGNVTENGSPVNAKITYSLEGKNNSFDAQGNFEIIINTPENEGEFLLNIKAERDNRIASRNITFSVYKKIFLRISVPTAVEISANQSKSFVITISNEGQKDINNIVLSTDLPSSWYSLDNSAFNLEAGEKKNIELALSIPENTEGRSARISAKGDEASANSEFMLNIAKPEIKQIATGQVVSDAINTYLVIFSIISISIVFFAFAIKKKNSKKQKAATEMLLAAKSEVEKRKRKSAKEVVKNPFE